MLSTILNLEPQKFEESSGQSHEWKRDSIRNIRLQGPGETKPNLGMQFLQENTKHRRKKKSEQRGMCELPLDKRIELTEHVNSFSF